MDSTLPQHDETIEPKRPAFRAGAEQAQAETTRVRAAPEKGEANAALEKLLAKSLGVPKSNVQVARGTTARLKTIEIEGLSDAEIAAFLDKLKESP